jgi:predicted ABC-type ATPase
MTETEDEIQQAAIQHARSIKKKFAKSATDKMRYPKEENPVSVFMAGSPGAGKTEASKALLESFDNEVIRIDADDYRDEFKKQGYSGDNSWLFQPAVSILVEKIHDLVIEQQQSFVLDGTLTKYDKALKNIERSIQKGRQVHIIYVYQDPLRAWEFVKAREAVEGRKIPRDRFIEQYFTARDCVNRLKQHFGSLVKVDLLLQNRNNQLSGYQGNISSIDSHVDEKYTALSLETLLSRD